MVLFKRKPVKFLPQPEIEDDDVECWIVPETKEVLLSYESYLQRMDWYKAKKFICEITGHSGLTFFEALSSETAGAKEVEGAFPDALKEPVLRKVQFSTVSRIDNLVDQVYDEFKSDFYPGEQVTVLVEDGQKLNGIVRDKAKFPEIKELDGRVTREAFSRYFVKLVDRPNHETLVDDSNVVRDRKIFTKQMLRSFIKNSVTRESWNGAPWLVKPHWAELYRIDTNVPLHLQHGHRIAEKKEKRKSAQEGIFGIWQTNKLPELKPAPNGKKGRSGPEQLSAAQQNQYENYQKALHGDPELVAQLCQMSSATDLNAILSAYPPGQLPSPHDLAVQLQQQMAAAKEPPQPVPPPIKYPVEDMECPPLHNDIFRPPLKFLAEAQCNDDSLTAQAVAGLQRHMVGPLLEIWNTLNVYCQVLALDSFTFDDFIDAMQFSEDDVECELLVEIHCAVLKQLVNAETDQEGAIQISLPDLPEPEDSNEDDDEEEQEKSRLPTPTPEPDVPARRTRSSLNKILAAEEARAKSPTPDVIRHRAAEMFKSDYGWIDRLRKRDFRHGGWQLIVVGLLHQLAGRPRVEDSCNRILEHLAPLDADPNMETALAQYSTMDINLRVELLQIICQSFVETKAVKKFLEDTANTMTKFRKVKIEHQRARKDAIAALKKLHDERRLLAPQEKSPTPIPDLEESMDVDKLADLNGNEVEDTEEEEVVVPRSLRRGQDRAAERKRKREQEQERKDKVKEEKANKGSREYQKVLKTIQKERAKIDEHEEQIEIIDGDLREADAYRTRCLGKDRFCNRYWWFERNAMPYGGLPDSSTANAGYANGRLWVQGPDDMERIGYIDVPEEMKQNYHRNFHITPGDRKTLEEGSTSLHGAHDWGYYDTIEDVDRLIEWLDARGIRELKLRKELKVQRVILEKYMNNRHTYLAPRSDSLDPEVKALPTRMSTRTKTYVSEDMTQIHRCLKWKNTAAVRDLGHRHVDPPPQKTKKGKKPAELTASKKNTAKQSVAFDRHGKPAGRQGTRYTF